MPAKFRGRLKSPLYLINYAYIYLYGYAAISSLLRPSCALVAPWLRPSCARVTPESRPSYASVAPWLRALWSRLVAP